MNGNFAEFWKQNVFNLVKQNISLLLTKFASDSCCKLMFIIRTIICSRGQLITENLQNTLLHERLNDGQFQKISSRAFSIFWRSQFVWWFSLNRSRFVSRPNVNILESSWKEIYFYFHEIHTTDHLPGPWLRYLLPASLG